MSILSFPQRGPWGDKNWRGNCSGHVYQELFQRLRPSFVIDPMVGSGTSIDVANEMGIEALGLDLHSGFNILRDSITERAGKQADLVISHPPYGSMILYSGGQWGDAPHPDDLSRCIDDTDFHEKMQVALLNQRQATKEGGYYGTIIGDWRRNGIYTSYQAECISRMPADELAAVLVKAQHNTTSARKTYGSMNLPFILHEYILLWRRKTRTTFQVLGIIASEQATRVRATWKAIVRNTMMELGGKANLETMYVAISKGSPERIQQNPNWKAKIRQTLNSSSDYFSEARGIWAIA